MSPDDPEQCPLCQQPNRCGIAAGKSHCWCFETEVDAGARQRAYDLVGEQICVCSACGRPRAAARAEGASPMERALEVVKRRS